MRRLASNHSHVSVGVWLACRKEVQWSQKEDKDGVKTCQFLHPEEDFLGEGEELITGPGKTLYLFLAIPEILLGMTLYPWTLNSSALLISCLGSFHVHGFFPRLNPGILQALELGGEGGCVI